VPNEPAVELSPGNSWTGYSPNVDEGLSLPQAYARLHSANQKAFKDISRDILNTAGIKNYEMHDVLGNWTDGAENGLFHVLRDPVDPELSKYVAAWHGLLGNQKQVLHFVAGDGPDSFYQLFLPTTSAADVSAALDKFGIPFRALMPRRDGTLVAIYDEKKRLRPNVQALAEHYNATVREARGRGEFLGDPAGSSRTKARAEYRSVINRFESVHTGAAGALHNPDAGRPSQPGSLYQKSVPLGEKVRLEAVKAPEGGAVVRGMSYTGGQFLPDMPSPDPLPKVEQLAEPTSLPSVKSPAPMATGYTKPPSYPTPASKFEPRDVDTELDLRPPPTEPGQFNDLPIPVESKPFHEEIPEENWGLFYDQASRKFADTLGNAMKPPASPVSPGGLTPAHVEASTRAVHGVLRAMPVVALHRVNQNLRHVRWYATTDALSASLYHHYPEWAKQQIDPQTGKQYQIGGVYTQHMGVLWLDGPDKVASLKGGDPTSKADQLHHIYAHELMHVLDGPEHEISNGDQWAIAHAGELRRNPVSQYSLSHPKESFAEFGRLLYTRHLPTHSKLLDPRSLSLADIERLYPIASHIFKENGLWPISPNSLASLSRSPTVR
jgi:hypothetical protein